MNRGFFATLDLEIEKKNGGRGMELSTLKCYLLCKVHYGKEHPEFLLVLLKFKLISFVCLCVCQMCEDRCADTMAHMWWLEDNFQELSFLHPLWALGPNSGL